MPRFPIAPLLARLLPALLAALASVAVAGATEPVPSPPTAAFAALAGDFELTSTFWPAADAEPIVTELPAHREVLLGGRVLRLDVGPSAGGFEGSGLSGWDQHEERHWYVWTDTSTAGVAVLHGRLAADGSGRLEGRTPTPHGYSPLRVEIRRRDRVEIHDYFVPTEDGGERRYLELRYVRAGTR